MRNKQIRKPAFREYTDGTSFLFCTIGWVFSRPLLSLKGHSRSLYDNVHLFAWSQALSPDPSRASRAPNPQETHMVPCSSHALFVTSASHFFCIILWVFPFFTVNAALHSRRTKRHFFFQFVHFWVFVLYVFSSFGACHLARSRIHYLFCIFAHRIPRVT